MTGVKVFLAGVAFGALLPICCSSVVFWLLSRRDRKRQLERLGVLPMERKRA